jgi:hypothetical protein
MKLGKALATGYAQEEQEPRVAPEQREQHRRERTDAGLAPRAAAEDAPHEAPSAR